MKVGWQNRPTDIMRCLFIQLAAVIPFLIHSGATPAAEIRVAVASNFYVTAKEIARRFENETNHTVALSAGSTGKHFAQIIHGAPFDLLLAADQVRPLELEKRGFVKAKQRRIYAYGRLVLWQPAGLISKQLDVTLRSAYRKLAIANPRLAPYGRAAMEVLESLSLNKLLVSKVVQGENIAQAYQFVASGNAEMGFLALSQMDQAEKDRFLIVPTSLHKPINQQVVVLSESDAAAAFFAFLGRPSILQLIRQSGYDTPDE